MFMPVCALNRTSYAATLAPDTWSSMSEARLFWITSAQGLFAGAGIVICPSVLVLITAFGASVAFPSRLTTPSTPTLHLVMTGQPVLFR